MKKIRVISLLLAFTMLFSACNVSNDKPKTDDPTNSLVKTGNVEYREAYFTEFTTLDYNNASTSTVSYHGALTVAILVDYDRFGIIQPVLAKSWDVSADGTVYTFHLRDDVDWYTVDGKVYAKATAHDFVDTAKWMLTAENACIINNNLTAVLVNAQAYLDGTVTDFSQVGVRAINDYTLEYTLISPIPYFLSMLTYGSFYPSNIQFREEMGDRYGTANEAMLYSGPYIMSTFDPENKQVYTKNSNYWDVDSFQINTIERIYNKEAQTIEPELYLRGEIDQAEIRAAQLDEWINNPERAALLYNAPATQYTYFYAFNFDPRYAEEYGPENWRKAVNNLNFRKSFFHGVDLVSIAMTLDPYNPEQILIGTFNLRNFITTPDGTDYVDQSALSAYTGNNPYNVTKAQEYKQAAMQELAGIVEFPVKVVMPYNTGKADLTQRAQLLEQQMERDLGADFIDVILLPYPSTGYSAEVRNTGIWSFFEANWGPDYNDPVAVLDPFNGGNAVGKRYGRVYLAEDTYDASGNPTFQKMLEAADKEVLDIAKRYRMVAEAEQYLLDNAMALPFYRSGYEYYVSRLDPFSGNNTQTGRLREKLLGKVMLERPYTPEEYIAAEARYNEEREKALKAAAK